MAKIKVTAGRGIRPRLPLGLAIEQPTYLENPNDVPQRDGESDEDFARRTIVEVDEGDAFVVVGLRSGDLIPATPARKHSPSVLTSDEIEKLKARSASTATDFDMQAATTDAADKGSK